MRFTEFKRSIPQLESGRVLIDLDSLEKYPSDNNKLTVLVRDRRSFQRDGVWHVYPIALSESQAYIVCPYCGEIHVHGNNKGDYEGFRSVHCHSTYERRKDYCIDNLPKEKGGETI